MLLFTKYKYFDIKNYIKTAIIYANIIAVLLLFYMLFFCFAHQNGSR
jgi:hypothetical protein